MSIRRKLQLLFFFATLVPLSAAFALHTTAFYSTQKSMAIEHLRASARQAASRLDDLMLGASRDFRALASDPNLPTAPAEEISSRLAEFSYAYPYVKELNWVDAGGEIAASSNRTAVGSQLIAFEPELARLFPEAASGPAGQFRISDLDNVLPALRAAAERGGVEESALDIHFLVRVNDRRGEFRGVLVETMGTDLTRDVLSEVSRLATGGLPVLMLNQRNEVLSSSHPHDGVLVPLPGLPPGAEIGDSSLNGKAQSIAGRRVFTSLATTDGLGAPRALNWRVLLQARESDVHAAVWGNLATTTAVIFVLLAVAAPFDFVAWRNIGRRIGALAAVSRQVASGDRSARARLSDRDELAVLGQAFNAALDEVAASEARLRGEADARQRMAEDLRAANRALAEELSYRETAEAGLREALEEKDHLLREIHHRVKNNLQVVVSLVRLQADAAAPAAVDDLRQIEARVRAIAAVHEHTYRAPNMARVDMNSYLGGLLAELHRAWPTAGSVQLRFEGPAPKEPMERAVTFGLIATELVMNSFKHAFPNGRPGHITVRWREDEDGFLHFEVEDDGAGAPPEALPDQGSLGLHLVEILARQLQASVAIETSPGFRVRLSFRKTALRGDK